VVKRVKEGNKGFSLIELIIVVTIMTVLTTVLAPALLRYVEQSRMDTVMAECRNCVSAVRTVALGYDAAGAPVTTETAKEAAFHTEVRTLAQTPADALIDEMIFTNSSLTQLSYTNRSITVLFSHGIYLVLGRDAAPPPAEYTPNFTDVRDPALTPEQKALAIEENARGLAVLIEQALKTALTEAHPDAVYSNKGGAVLTGTPMTSCTLYDKDGKQIGVSGSYATDVQSHFKALLAEQGVVIGYTTCEFEKVPGTSYYSATPSKITFKANALTGSQMDTDRYTYYVATGQLVRG